MGHSARHGQRANRKPETGWEHVADWYIRRVGKDGFEHHREVTIPAVLDLLAAKPGVRVLDVGCGTGVLAPAITDAHAQYVGVDVSSTMIRFAQRQHGRIGKFIVADARRLHRHPELVGNQCDAAVFLLSVQDMDPLSDIFDSLARVLCPDGRVVILMTHPCFRVPRQSGWVWDDDRQLQSRRVDRYLTPLVVPMETSGNPSPGATARFHRPLSEYVEGLARVGFLVDRLVEIPTQKAEAPGPRAGAESLAIKEIPMFLGLRARRQP